jgi:hypothetical protein
MGVARILLSMLAVTKASLIQAGGKAESEQRIVYGVFGVASRDDSIGHGFS